MKDEVQGHRLPPINGNGNAGVWKWLTAFLAGALLAGAPSYALLLSKPSDTKFDKLQTQVDDLRIANSQISTQILQLQQQIALIQAGPR